MMQISLTLLISVGLGYVCVYYLTQWGVKFIIIPIIGIHSLKSRSIHYEWLRWMLASIVFGVAFIRFGMGWHGWLVIVLCIGLFILATLDWDYWLLPDQLTLSLLWLGLLSNCYLQLTHLHAAVLGAWVGYVSLWLIGQLFYRLTGRFGMGYGDYKLLAAIGAWLGWQALPTVVLIASTLACIFSVCSAIWQKNKVAHHQPFGYYLALSTWLVLIN